MRSCAVCFVANSARARLSSQSQYPLKISPWRLTFNLQIIQTLRSDYMARRFLERPVSGLAQASLSNHSLDRDDYPLLTTVLETAVSEREAELIQLDKHV